MVIKRKPDTSNVWPVADVGVMKSVETHEGVPLAPKYLHVRLLKSACRIGRKRCSSGTVWPMVAATSDSVRGT